MKARGFTLLEMLITLLLLGILASISYPSYQQYILRSYRAQAVTTLLELAARQEQYLLAEGRYATNAIELGLSSALTLNGRYQLQLSASTAPHSYLLLLTAQGPQQQDQLCRQFSLNHLGQRNPGLAEPLSCLE